MEEKNILSRIARYLILQSSFIQNLGLLNGKMGIAVFFYHYAKFTNCSVYEDFAGELIDEVIQGVHRNYPLDFKNGIAGVGWGFGYLSQYGFIEISPESLLDYDKGITENKVDYSEDYSMLSGLKGLVYYVISRYNGGQLFVPEGFITKEYVARLLSMYRCKDNPTPEDIHLLEQLDLMLQNRSVSLDMEALLRSYINIPLYTADNLFDIGLPLGMSCGLAGIGLKMLLSK